ncbi:MAG: transporter substrate-binding domain-containing protein [Parvibaculaceae bacterium]
MRFRLSLWDAAFAAFLLATPAEADALSDIKAKGEFVVGMEVAYKPFEYFDNGQTVGFDIDVANEIAGAMGVKLKTVDTQWAGILPALLTKKFDVILSGMTITNERMKKVNFSSPVAVGTMAFLVREHDHSLNVPEDTDGKIVATQLGSIGDKIAKAYEEKLKASGKSGYKEYKLYDAFPEAYVDLNNGRIDAVVGALPVLQALTVEQPGKYRIVEGVQDVEAYLAMAIRKEDEALLAFVNQELKKMKESGRFAEIQKKWFGTTQTIPDAIPEVLP